MNVLLVSECGKRALVETRRILDQFAERRGERTWQTSITEAGLSTLRKLLRKTARKNTAVACHWIRGRDHTELLWIVGDARRFNAEGAVPTNTTTHDVLRADDENDWRTAESIRLLAQLAALLHDLGKASVAFQQRLRGERRERNLIRHEWMSLRLFVAFVGDDDDVGWLSRMAEQPGDTAAWTGPGLFLRDGVDLDADSHPFRDLARRAPLAAAVGWLVVTHHRLPVAPAFRRDGTQDWLGRKSEGFDRSWLTDPLANLTRAWNEIAQRLDANAYSPYWKLAACLPVENGDWSRQAKRIARRLLLLCRQGTADWLDNVWRLHLARLCLMLADHHYSSLGVQHGADVAMPPAPVPARIPFLSKALRFRVARWEDAELWANTWRDRAGLVRPNQPLLEHLTGVSAAAGQIAHALPGFERYLPRLAQHRGLRRRSADPRFAWQDKAFDAAASMRTAAREHGAFIVNMASTGCGKTLGNARILYALADPQRGVRASFALGLRTLTLQTGRAYRRDLFLDDEDLAVLVGGSASRALFEFHERMAEAGGSASVQALLEEGSHVLYEGRMADHPLLSRALGDATIRKLLSAPLLVCTIDHLVPAADSLRAGRQVAPLLRLMSSDLVLDELDDYDMDDLPALTRLVFFAGMAGTRIVLSSATLPPALVQGMFRAYQAGRSQHRRNRGDRELPAGVPVEVPCMWVDEFARPQRKQCVSADDFANAHERFVQGRVAHLERQAPLRIARLQKLDIAPGQKREAIRARFASHVHAACLEMHHAHAMADPVTGVRASFGIVRMAHIGPLIDVARELHSIGAPDGMRIHLCVYHSRFPLAQRSAIEAMLDAVFDRRDGEAVWRHPDVRAAIDATPGDTHVFVALCSPVCEVGRDWDADWAVAEPSSMRSIIQLSGRVQRHRRQSPDQPNVVLLDTNLRALEGPGAAAFQHPGFEDGGRFPLESHRLSILWPDADGWAVDAVPRILPRPEGERQPSRNLGDLEHARMEAAMRPLPDLGLPSVQMPGRRRRGSAGRASLDWQRDLSAPCWQFPRAGLTGVLPQHQPFREEAERTMALAFLPDDDESRLVAHRVEEQLEKAGRDPYVEATLYPFEIGASRGVVPWGAMSLTQLLGRVRELAEAEDMSLRTAAARFTVVDVPASGRLAWSWSPWLGLTADA